MKTAKSRKEQPKPQKTAGPKKAGPVEPIMPERVIREVVKAYLTWLWEVYRACRLPIGHIANLVRMTRQGFTRLLRRQTKRLFFDTFIAICFLRMERDCGITIEVEGWKIELRWRITQSNRSCLSDKEKQP